MWFVVTLLGTTNGRSTFITFLLAGLVFSVLNATLKPLLRILSLPVILLTLGLFTLIVNGFVIWLTIIIVPNISMGFWHAVLAGIVMSALNYSISNFAESRKK